jgi:hypothetical protein
MGLDQEGFGCEGPWHLLATTPGCFRSGCRRPAAWPSSTWPVLAGWANPSSSPSTALFFVLRPHGVAVGTERRVACVQLPAVHDRNDQFERQGHRRAHQRRQDEAVPVQDPLAAGVRQPRGPVPPVQVRPALVRVRTRPRDHAGVGRSRSSSGTTWRAGPSTPRARPTPSSSWPTR